MKDINPHIQKALQISKLGKKQNKSSPKFTTVKPQDKEKNLLRIKKSNCFPQSEL